MKNIQLLLYFRIHSIIELPEVDTIYNNRFNYYSNIKRVDVYMDVTIGELLFDSIQTQNKHIYEYNTTIN